MCLTQVYSVESMKPEEQIKDQPLKVYLRVSWISLQAPQIVLIYSLLPKC